MPLETAACEAHARTEHEKAEYEHYDKRYGDFEIPYVDIDFHARLFAAEYSYSGS